MASKTKKQISKPELITYIGCGLFILWGLTYIVLGLLAAYLPIADASNPIKIADNTIRKLFGMGYFGWGLFLVGLFALIMAIVLIALARNTDKEYERQQRRAARLARIKEDNQAPEVVDAEVK